MAVENSPDIVSLVAAAIISAISGFISIANRIAKGMAWSSLLIEAEFSAAILCGGLMYDTYPEIAHEMPSWCTRWVATALAAHFGGRVLQFAEKSIIEKISKAVSK